MRCPKTVFADFWMAIHAAVRKICPQSHEQGCHFHLAQARWRKIQKLGLSKSRYSKNKES